MNFPTPRQFCLPTNVTFLPLISENEGSPPPEQEANVGTGGENLHQPACCCWGGHSPQGYWSSWSRCHNHHGGNHQLLRGIWDLYWGNNSPRSQDHRGSDTTTSLDHPWLSTPPGSSSLPPHSQWLGLSIQYLDGEQLFQWLQEGAW